MSIHLCFLEDASICIYIYTYLIFNDIFMYIYICICIWYTWNYLYIFILYDRTNQAKKNAKHLLCTSQGRSCSSSSSKWPSQSNSRDALDAWPPRARRSPRIFLSRWRTPIVEIAFKMAFQWLMRPPKSCWIMIAKPFDCVEKIFTILGKVKLFQFCSV